MFVFYKQLAYFYFMYVCVCVPACVYMHHMHICFLRRSEEGVRAPETGVRVAVSHLCGCWELNWHPLQEQQGL